MRVLAVLAHDRKDSLNAYLFNKLIEHLKAEQCEVDILDLHDRAKDIPFYSSIRDPFTGGYPLLDTNPFYQELKDRFMAADRLVIVHPVYWYSVPGILKCWIDLITNHFWRYEGGIWATPKHKIKKMLIVHTASASWLTYKFVLANTARTTLWQTFRWFGIPKVYFYEIFSVYSQNERTVARHVNKILKLSKKLL